MSQTTIPTPSPTESLYAAGLDVPEPPADNVVEALRRVMRDLPGIGKGERMAGPGGGYAYRGIEAITREAQELFARHGVLCVPHVEGLQIRDVEVGGKPWTDTVLTVSYTIYGPGNGPNDAIQAGPFVGIGRDGSDKGSNKALTQCLKQCLLQVLCISDKADDVDLMMAEADARPRSQRSAVSRNQGPMADPEGEPTSAGNTRRGPAVLEGFADIEDQRAAHKVLTDLAESMDDGYKDAMKAWRKEHNLEGWPLPKAQLDQVVAEAQRMLAEPM